MGSIKILTQFPQVFLSTRRVMLLSLVALIQVAFFASGCEAPRVEERFTDRVSGRWRLDIQGSSAYPDRVFAHRLLIDQFDGKVVGIMLSVDEGALLPVTDVHGTFKGDTIEFGRYLRGVAGYKFQGLNAGSFRGTVSADGTRMAGEAVLDKDNNGVRAWRATRLSSE